MAVTSGFYLATRERQQLTGRPIHWKPKPSRVRYELHLLRTVFESKLSYLGKGVLCYGKLRI